MTKTFEAKYYADYYPDDPFEGADISFGEEGVMEVVVGTFDTQDAARDANFEAMRKNKYAHHTSYVVERENGINAFAYEYDRFTADNYGTYEWRQAPFGMMWYPIS